MRKFSVVLLFLAGCYSLENRMVFQPAVTDHVAQFGASKLLKNVYLTTKSGDTIHGRWCPHPQSNSAVLVLHGNAGNLEHRAPLVFDLWKSLHRSVLIIDYPGYGASGGKPSEKGCYDAADAAMDWLIAEKKISPKNVIIFGQSLGGAVAVDMASRRDHGALVLVRTFPSIPEVARNQMPFLSSGLMYNQFPSEKKLPQCQRPTFIAHGDQDRLMPPEFGQRLRKAAGGPVDFYEMKGFGHNTPLDTQFYIRLKAFADRAVPQQLSEAN